jgi:hypothetical protein
MLKRSLAGLSLLSLLLLTPTKTTAQVSGFAWAEFTQGEVLDGFVGPFKGTDTGIQLRFAVLCMGTAPRTKVAREVTATIPDGSTLLDVRIASTTAVVAGCAEYGITVPRGAVLLPAINFGQ